MDLISASDEIPDITSFMCRKFAAESAATFNSVNWYTNSKNKIKKRKKIKMLEFKIAYINLHIFI